MWYDHNWSISGATIWSLVQIQSYMLGLDCPDRVHDGVSICSNHHDWGCWFWTMWHAHIHSGVFISNRRLCCDQIRLCPQSRSSIWFELQLDPKGYIYSTIDYLLHCFLLFYSVNIWTHSPWLWQEFRVIALNLQFYLCLYHCQRGRRQTVARPATHPVIKSQ